MLPPWPIRVVAGEGQGYHRAQPEPEARHTAGEHRIVRIDEVEGIGPAYASKLATAGVDTTDELL
ncbi:MAG TPA: hypothetical protein VD763_06955, partial [Candidatus Saccharimonadales bacterium]|nr:hypothetical protein [Candidatus Saccharimonadales bacterium]